MTLAARKSCAVVQILTLIGTCLTPDGMVCRPTKDCGCGGAGRGQAACCCALPADASGETGEPEKNVEQSCCARFQNPAPRDRNSDESPRSCCRSSSGSCCGTSDTPRPSKAPRNESDAPAEPTVGSGCGCGKTVVTAIVGQPREVIRRTTVPRPAPISASPADLQVAAGRLKDPPLPRPPRSGCPLPAGPC